MTLSELEAAIGWLERNRFLSTCRCSTATLATPVRSRRGDWKPRVGRYTTTAVGG